MATHRVCLSAAFCSLIVLAAFIDSTQSASCCLRYTKRWFPCQLLQNYSIQTINTSCDIPAIIFHLRNGYVCADPSSKWAQRGMRCVGSEWRRKNRQPTPTDTESA